MSAMGLLRRRRETTKIDDLKREGEERLADAQATVERLAPKVEYQEGRHRRNAVYEEAAWVLSRAGRTTH